MYVLQFDISSLLAIKYTLTARQIWLMYCFIFQRRIHWCSLTWRLWRSKNICFVFITRFRNQNNWYSLLGNAKFSYIIHKLVTMIMECADNSTCDITINVELKIKLENNNVTFSYQQGIWYLINIIWQDRCPKAKMHKGVQKRNVCSQITWNERCCQESTSKAILNTLNFKPQFKQRQV